ncbi:XK-related protein 9 [Stegostoma tigrinum]|uniref:XK-related protein 9 n=1 Tax=Stegostoma tigrinum TaxID=3053191 RepID=UPI00202B9515|nr:XK-related protein 9 [Stegostoma tigrinum]
MAVKITFTKFDFALTLAGFLLYFADIGTDLWVAAVYFNDNEFTWFALVLAAISLSALVLQSFSWSWYQDDRKIQQQQNSSETQHSHYQSRSSTCPWLCVLHIFQLGLPVRFCKALRLGYKAAFKQGDTDSAIYALADLSMLRLFEAFLEGAPQLVLQTFILLQSKDSNFIQYGSVIASFTSISWATVDYYAALKRSLPNPNLTCGFPVVFYFLYKLLTISATILSITLLVSLHILAVVAYLLILWSIMMVHVVRQETTFCNSKCQEIIYRIVVGIILIFTFFNVKGQEIRLTLTLYYIFKVFATTFIISLCWILKGSSVDKGYDLSISMSIMLSLTIGIVCAVIYYRCFHPQVYSTAATDEESNNSHTTLQLPATPDEVDGFQPENSTATLNNVSENRDVIHSSVPQSSKVNRRITNCLRE